MSDFALYSAAALALTLSACTKDNVAPSPDAAASPDTGPIEPQRVFRAPAPQFDQAVHSLAFTPNGKWLLAVDRTVSVWAVDTKAQTLTAAGWFGFAEQRQSPTGQTMQAMVDWAKANPAVGDMAMAPDGSWVAGLSLNGALGIWQLQPGQTPPAKRLTMLPAVVDQSYGIAASPDSKRLLVLGRPPERVAEAGAQSFDYTPEGMIQLWDIDPTSHQPARKRSQKLLLDRPGAASFSANGGHAAVVASSQTLAIVAIADDGAMTVHEQPSLPTTATDVYVSVTGKWLLLSTFDHTIERWSLNLSPTPSVERAQVFRQHTGKVREVAVVPNERWFVANSTDKTLSAWSLTRDEPGKVRRPAVFTAHATEQTYGVAVHPKAPLIATGGDEICLWKVNRDLLAEGNVSSDAPSSDLPKVDFATAMRVFCDAPNKIPPGLGPSEKATALAKYIEKHVLNPQFEALMSSLATLPQDKKDAALDAALAEVGIKSCAFKDAFAPRE